MAIRRVSDLPELTTIYQDADIDDCVFETSYKNDNIYQSFYVKGQTLTEKISEKIGDIVDLDAYVTKATDQEITGFKSFSNASGIRVNGTALKQVNVSGAAINAATSENNNVPTLKAVKDFVEGKGYITENDTSWKEPLELLKSMLSESNLTLYVDQQNGNDSNGGLSPTTALKTVEKALALANKRKYINNAYFTVYIIGTYKVTANSNGSFTLFNLYHPDMTGTRYAFLRGYMPTGQTAVPEIQIDYTNVSTWYACWLYIYSNTKIYDLKITAIWNTQNAGGAFPSSGTYSEKANYIYKACWAGTAITTRNGCSVETENLTIDGFRWGIAGQCALGNTAFNNCTVCASAGVGDTIQCNKNQTVTVNGVCENPIRLTNPNSTFQLRYYTQFVVEQCNAFCSNNSNSTVYFTLHDSSAKDYINNSANKYGLKIQKLIKTVNGVDKEFNMSDANTHFLVASGDSDATKLNKIKNYLASIFGSSANVAFSQETEITPDFTTNTTTNRNLKFNIGPALVMFELNESSENLDHQIKVCCLQYSDWH